MPTQLYLIAKEIQEKNRKIDENRTARKKKQNEKLKIRYRTDKVFRERKLEYAREYRQKQKLKKENK